MMNIYKRLRQIQHDINDLLSVVENRPDSTNIRDVYNPAIKNLIKKYPQIDRVLDSAPQIWLGSDWHLWLKGDFKNPNKDELIRNQIQTVKPNDVFIMLGDLVHRDTYEENVEGQLRDIISKLKGKKILIMGNHDIFPAQFYADAGFDFVNDGFIWKNIIFSHVPLHFSAFQGAEYNVHGHTHGYNGDRRVPYKNHICIYSTGLRNMPITLNEAFERFERYKRPGLMDN